MVPPGVVAAVLLALTRLVAHWVVAVAVRVVWVMNIMKMVNFPVLGPIHVLLIVMIDHKIAMLVQEVVIVVVHVLLFMRVDQVLSQVAIMLAEQVRVDEGVMHRWDINSILNLMMTVAMVVIPILFVSLRVERLSGEVLSKAL